MASPSSPSGAHAKKQTLPGMPQAADLVAPATEPQHKLVLRTLRRNDFKAVKGIMDRVYSNMESAWSQDEYNNLIRKFPEGQICIEDNGKLVAVALAIIVEYSRFGDKHTYAKITGNGKFDTHDPEGDTLYGVRGARERAEASAPAAA